MILSRPSIAIFRTISWQFYGLPFLLLLCYLILPDSIIFCDISYVHLLATIVIAFRECRKIFVEFFLKDKRSWHHLNTLYCLNFSIYQYRSSATQVFMISSFQVYPCLYSFLKSFFLSLCIFLSPKFIILCLLFQLPFLCESLR